jgi:anti-sigma regulatory factor (Ser/Thr protein kinase)
MTSVARPAPRRLDSFAVPSEPGNERLALARVAESVASAGLSPSRLDRLKTAVAEATMNAIEHGNGNRRDVPVEIEVIQHGDEIIIAITDQGAEPHAGPGSPEEPDLAKKLTGGQSPRGWGLFLIRNMVDAMEVTTHGHRHTIRLTMRTDPSEGAGHDEQV